MFEKYKKSDAKSFRMDIYETDLDRLIIVLKGIREQHSNYKLSVEVEMEYGSDLGDGREGNPWATIVVRGEKIL